VSPDATALEGAGSPRPAPPVDRAPVARRHAAARGAAARPHQSRAGRWSAPLVPYDATAVLARGGRALTFVTGDGRRIPNYHQATDTVANLDARILARAVAVGREMIALIDRGRAD